MKALARERATGKGLGQSAGQARGGQGSAGCGRSQKAGAEPAGGRYQPEDSGIDRAGGKSCLVRRGGQGEELGKMRHKGRGGGWIKDGSLREAGSGSWQR